MLSKIPGLHRTLGTLAVFMGMASLFSCSNYNSGSRGGSTSGLKFRAFVSNPVHPTLTGGGVPALNIMDASKDLLSPYVVSLATLGNNVSDAGMIALSPNHDRTLVMSPRDSKLAVVDNVKEAIVGSFTLPGPSESFFVSSDNNSAFLAIPSASVSGQAPGVVQKVSSSGGTVDATVPIPGAHYLVQSPSGNQILVFSDNLDTAVLLTPGLIGAAGQPTTILQCTATQVPACTLPTTFDRPVGAIFDASGATAYVLNCGPECGGTTAGITAIDMTNTGNAASLVLGTMPLSASTTAFLQGATLYVAGSQVGSGGVLSVLNLASGVGSVNCTSGTPANCQVFAIADGYHTMIQMGANGRLFVGSKACSSLCLTIFDTVKGQVVDPPANSPSGDVTGIAPIPNRSVVYVCQGTLLRVYDTRTDQLAQIPPDGQPNLAGEAVDVKVIDF
jgi:hypothetical protein